jgi:diketogulonate reductase-like aldo/keto reductase
MQSKDWYDEEAVGQGLAASKIPRDQLFLTSKIHPRDLGYNQTLAAFQRALQHLRTTYLDLLLLHYPACFPSANCIPLSQHSWQRSWQALEYLVGEGKVRSIGEGSVRMGSEYSAGSPMCMCHWQAAQPH